MGRLSGGLHGVSTVVSYKNYSWWGWEQEQARGVSADALEAQRNKAANPITATSQREIDTLRKSVIALGQEISRKLMDLQQEHQRLNRLLKKHGLPEGVWPSIG